MDNWIAYLALGLALPGMIWITTRIIRVLARGPIYWEERLYLFLEDRSAARALGISLEAYRVHRAMEQMRRDGVL
jgi:hypothetical protein